MAGTFSAFALSIDLLKIESGFGWAHVPTLVGNLA
jgi:hypothetical protein